MKNNIQKIICLVLLAAFSLSLTACSTTFGTNAKGYVNNTSSVLKTLFSSNKVKSNDSAKESGPAKSQLPAPTDFTVDEKGNYAFTGVENAGYYLIYLCAPEAVNDNDSYIYCSQQIKASDTKKYEGKLSDIVKYAYGKYLIKALAFPNFGDSKYAMSKPDSIDYTYTGNQSDPKLAYYWNTFDNKMGVQVANMDEYLYQAYPDSIDITFTDTANSANNVTVSIANVSPKSNSVETDKLKKGDSYTITAVAKSSSKFVLNPTSGVANIASGLTLGDTSILSGPYSYSSGYPEGALNYPLVCTKFNLASGGSAGTAPAMFIGSIDYTCTPKTASAGSVHSYDININFVLKLTGSLELKSDGTFEVSLTPESGKGLSGSTDSGIWKDNGDGTATLSYDPGKFVMK